jgi:hypothetical protein
MGQSRILQLDLSAQFAIWILSFLTSYSSGPGETNHLRFRGKTCFIKKNLHVFDYSNCKPVAALRRAHPRPSPTDCVQDSEIENAANVQRVVRP